MEEGIGKATGAIWKTLSTKGELSLSQLKRQRRGSRRSLTGRSVGLRAKTRS
jgi:hypothetical protein